MSKITTIDLSKISNPTYSNVTVTSQLPSASISVNNGTGTTSPWGPPTTAGSIHAKDFVLDGISIKEMLEERLNMLVPNPALEREWDQLRELGDQYRKLEADLKEKARIWGALNKKS